MGAGGHFVKQIKFRIDLKWPEMRTKVNFKKIKKKSFKWPEVRSKVNFGYPK